LFTPGNTCKISHLALDNTELVYPRERFCRYSLGYTRSVLSNAKAGFCRYSLGYTRSVLSNTKWDILQVFPGVNKVSVIIPTKSPTWR
jgi:hypothetical protein